MKLITLANGQQLAVEHRGRITDPAIVFVNGFGGYQEIWTAQIQPLLHLHYQVITYDFRGQGASKGEYATSLKTLATDLAQLIGELNLQRPILIGHSMGCSVIWALRSYYPGILVKGLVLIDQTPKMINDSDWPFGFGDINQQNWQHTYYYQPAGHETLHGLVQSVLKPLNDAQLKAPFDRQKARPLLFDHFFADWRQTTLQEREPSLFVSALQSPYYQIGYGQWVADQNLNTTTVSIADCGHDIMAEVPEAFNQTLRHFLLGRCRPS